MNPPRPGAYEPRMGLAAGKQKQSVLAPMSLVRSSAPSPTSSSARRGFRDRAQSWTSSAVCRHKQIIYIYIYICMYVCIYIYIYVYIYIYIYTYRLARALASSASASSSRQQGAKWRSLVFAIHHYCYRSMHLHQTIGANHT